MASILLSSLKGSGGGTPIKGLQQFIAETPDDYTFQGQRFLRQGIIELDTSTFDTSIWDTQEYLRTSRLGDCIQSKGFQRLPSGTLVNRQAGLSTSLGFSDDDGATWTYPSAQYGGRASELSTGMIIFARRSGSTGYLSYTPDGVTTVSNVDTGTNERLAQAATDGTRTTVADESGVWRTCATTSLATWGNVSGAGEVILGSDLIYGNGNWVGIANADRSQVSHSTDGITFTLTTHSQMNTSGGSALIYDEYSSLFRLIQEVGTTAVFEMFTSADGLTWSAAIPLTTPAEMINAPTGLHVNENTGFMTGSSYNITGNVPLISEDSGVTWELLKDEVSGDNASLGTLSDNSVIFLSAEGSYGYTKQEYAGQLTPIVAGDDWQDRINEQTFVRIS